jgi:hypothetical protein
LPKEKVQDNTQGVSSSVNSNTQALPKESIEDNHQDIENKGLDPNHQPVGDAAVAPNHQDVPEDALDPNHQAAPEGSTAPNHQAAPEDTLPPNDQGVAKEHLQDHIEALPDTHVPRNTAEFSNKVIHAAPDAQAPAVARGKVVKKAISTATRAPAVSATAAQLAKAKHDKFMEEFHGRLAGIKHEVDEVNHKLDVFEQKLK